jgi:lipopolysaccharide/colanic/teichoic acid biosynthesis glycosyltransferase
MVCRERARADRSGGDFSVVTFRAEGCPDESPILRRIAKHLAERARIIDQYGWNGEDAVWLLLPHCPSDAGEKIAQDVCERFSAGKEQAAYDVYHYVGDQSGRKDFNLPTLKTERGNSTNMVDETVQSLAPVVARSMPRSKRVFDMTLAGAGLLAALPVFAVVALLIKLTSRGPVLFGQLRAGRGGEAFRMYKFRTMVVDAERLKSALRAQNEQDGPAFKIRKDPRITRVGRVLRATGVDELPQLWNVLRGEMSFVGPRPLPVDETANCAPWQQERLDITPGLTCWWQVSDRWTNIAFADWMRMDIRYARQRSLATDLKLIVRTIGFMIRRKGT